ncbi:tRNA (adenosine(37)-N6)-threonylcarbamoyltransferase complex dimerization subunit type 1 TsaB [Hellea balneolensis]|uniref:tRNA (adenosine(37)-N6)-threonylcarbamoyltransferase complex dimerization subunit type 1 TsaB n=1 Tax=Hellea balneolensis TaxID=287478 RepID=UPI00040A80C1|nr:tRNA (adenosine(37)-N6)-threonylcarbamoyltransferase complex dimerization subunit type 1 TsaB [Hellea balneolensis]
MIILGLDTTGPNCSVASVDTAKVLAYKSEKIGRGHAERLAPMVAEVLADAGLSAIDVDKLAVCTGPGSFTGLRVALAFAKGFALPRKLPVVGLSSLAVWAAQADPMGQKKVISIADVRRGELCWSAIFHGQAFEGCVTQKAEAARATIATLKPDLILEDEIVDTRKLAWLAADLSAADYPATPLYSRGPDAKLPGGLEPNL